MMQGMQHLPYQDRQRELGMFNLEKGRLWGVLGETFQYLKGCKEEGDRFFLAGFVVIEQREIISK